MSIDYEKLASDHTDKIKSKSLFRQYPIISQISDKPPYGINHKNGKEVLIFGNNNYLGLSQHPEIIQAKIKATQKYGTGSSGTRNILGTSKSITELEERIAHWQKKEASLVHISALDANIGILSALGKNLPNAIFLSDEKNHASMIDGIKLSGAEKYIFQHNNIEEVENKLESIRSEDQNRAIIIAIESLYSMDGDFAPLEEFIRLKKKYNALLFVDEVHANGIYGETGAGYAEQLGLSNDIDFILGTFAKSVGVNGGFLAASKNMIEFLRHESRNFIFTSALSADTAEAIIKSIEIITSDEGTKLREKLFQNITYFRNSLTDHKIDYLENESHITPILFGDEQRTSNIAKDLLHEYNLAATPIYYPTVPMNKARLRINVTPNHSFAMIDQLCNALATLITKYPNSSRI